MSDQIKSNKAGYDVLHNPIAPNLLFNIGEQPESVYLYTPHIVPTGNGWNLVWTNNAGLDNPPTIHIMDGEKGNNGTTFTPHVTAVTGGYEISWTNDTGEVNPDPVTILNGVNGQDGAPGANGSNGATFTPHIEEVSNGVRISWTNDGGLVNPNPVVLTNGHNGIDGVNGQDGEDGTDGITYTPHVTQTQNGYELSWTNDGGQTNPPTVSLSNGRDGVSPSVSVRRVTGGAEISVTDGAGTTTAIILDGTNGDDGINGVGIASIAFKETDANGNNVYTITLTNGSTYDITCPKGPAGANGTDGTDGATIWTTNERTHFDSVDRECMYISDLNGAGDSPKEGDLIVSYYTYNGFTTSLLYSIKSIVASNEVEVEFVANIKGATGQTGATGADGVGVSSVTYKETDTNGNYIYTITLSNGSTYDITCPRGPQGQTGATGQTGPAGPGVPAGGTAGQVLQKASGTDYDATWVTLQGGGGIDLSNAVYKNYSISGTGSSYVDNSAVPAGVDLRNHNYMVVIDLAGDFTSSSKNEHKNATFLTLKNINAPICALVGYLSGNSVICVSSGTEAASTSLSINANFQGTLIIQDIWPGSDMVSRSVYGSTCWIPLD